MRNGCLDYCRLIAAFGIVWFHTEAPGYRIAYAALPFFLVLLALPSRSGLAERARRLLVPFVVWSVIYAVFRVLVAVKNGQEPFGWWQPQMLVMGTSIHLWFLPFAFLVAALTPLLRGRHAIVLPLLAAGLLAIAGETGRAPWYQWGFGLIPALAGFAFLQHRGLGLLSLAGAYLVLELFRPSPDNPVIVGGAAMALLALSIRLPATAVSAWCARLSMWVYLGHILVIHRFQSDGLDGYALGLASMAGALVLAVGIEMVLRRMKPRTGPAPSDPSG